MPRTIRSTQLVDHNNEPSKVSREMCEKFCTLVNDSRPIRGCEWRTDPKNEQMKNTCLAIQARVEKAADSDVETQRVQESAGDDENNPGRSTEERYEAECAIV